MCVVASTAFANNEINTTENDNVIKYEKSTHNSLADALEGEVFGPCTGGVVSATFVIDCGDGSGQIYSGSFCAEHTEALISQLTSFCGSTNLSSQSAN